LARLVGSRRRAVAGVVREPEGHQWQVFLEERLRVFLVCGVVEDSRYLVIASAK
jgi:hypothetical protein